MDPKKYGFYDCDGTLEPITYKGSLAPEKLIKTILCNCKKSGCKSGNCSCKNFGLYCNEMCGCTDNCKNIDPIDNEEGEFSNNDIDEGA